MRAWGWVQRGVRDGACGVGWGCCGGAEGRGGWLQEGCDAEWLEKTVECMAWGLQDEREKGVDRVNSQHHHIARNKAHGSTPKETEQRPPPCPTLNGWVALPPPPHPPLPSQAHRVRGQRRPHAPLPAADRPEQQPGPRRRAPAAAHAALQRAARQAARQPEARAELAHARDRAGLAAGGRRKRPRSLPLADRAPTTELVLFPFFSPDQGRSALATYLPAAKAATSDVYGTLDVNRCLLTHSSIPHPTPPHPAPSAAPAGGGAQLRLVLRRVRGWWFRV